MHALIISGVPMDHVTQPALQATATPQPSLVFIVDTSAAGFGRAGAGEVSVDRSYCMELKHPAT